jgi:hypothetical protein
MSIGLDFEKPWKGRRKKFADFARLIASAQKHKSI